MVAVVGAGLLATLGVVAEVRDRQADAAAVRAQEHHEQQAVDLLLSDDWSGTSSYEPATDQLSYRVELSVRNDGPRDVQLLAIGLPGVQLGAPIELDAGRERPLSLEGSWSCGANDSSSQAAPTTVPFEVRTDAGPRYVDLPIPPGMFDTDPLADACDRARAAGAQQSPAGT